MLPLALGPRHARTDPLLDHGASHAVYPRRVAQHRRLRLWQLAREFWRFVMVQQYVEKLALTAVDYPPMQDPASFNLDAVKKKVQEMIKHREGQ